MLAYGAVPVLPTVVAASGKQVRPVWFKKEKATKAEVKGRPGRAQLGRNLSTAPKQQPC